MKNFLLLLIISGFVTTKTYSQNLTGTWQGEGDYKIVILHINDSCFGYTYDTGMGYCKANFIGTYNDSTKKLKGINTDFIERTLSHGLSSYRLSYSNNGNAEYLKGKASAKSTAAKILSFGLGASVSYRKISDKYDTTKFLATKLGSHSPIAVATDSIHATVVVDKKDSSSSPVDNTIAVLSRQKEARSSQLVNTITTDVDSLRLTLHDNGEIDNDTVTVFLNGKIIVNQLGLTAKLYETVIPINTGDSVQSIELMANNLGSIPPNTAYLTIWAGKEKHELRVSSDYRVNARIDIRHQPKSPPGN